MPGPPLREGTAVNAAVDRHPRIGDRVLIYGYISVLGGITVGDDCVRGTRCILTESIPKGSRVRIVNQYQILRVPEGKASEQGGSFDIYGLVPREEGKFEIHGRNLTAPEQMSIVNEFDQVEAGLSVELLATSTEHGTITTQVVPTEQVCQAVQTPKGPKELRARLIKARLKIACVNGSLLYIAQAEGLRRSIEESLRVRGFWHG